MAIFLSALALIAVSAMICYLYTLKSSSGKLGYMDEPCRDLNEDDPIDSHGNCDPITSISIKIEADQESGVEYQATKMEMEFDPRNGGRGFRNKTYSITKSTANVKEEEAETKVVMNCDTDQDFKLEYLQPDDRYTELKDLTKMDTVAASVFSSEVAKTE